jgi:membrane protease YdiL (CAAX protease family)
MTDEDFRQPPEAAAASQRSGNVKLMFYGAQGLRAGWKVLLFAAIVITLFLATRPLINSVAPRSPGPVSPQIDLTHEFWLALLVLVATSVMVRIDRRPLRSYGFTDSAGLQRLCFGVCWGLLSISALVGALWVHGSLVFDGFPSANGHALPDAAAATLGTLLVGLVEESLARGYPQFVLARALGFWWTALTLSLIFGLLHGGNGGETWIGLFGAGALGLFLCLSLWYTKSLFWAVGFHSGFNWGESYLYGAPRSGSAAPWRLIATHPTGDLLWSGGSAGPEGSLLLVPLIVASTVVMCLWWGRGRAALGLRERWQPSSG